MFVVGEHWLAPALPSPVPLGSSEAADAVYRRDQVRVWRESGGAPALFLTREATAPAPGAPFDLLWFGDSERYLLHKGRLVVEDVFSELRLSPKRSTLEHELVRVRRADPAILEGLDLGEAAAEAEMTVRRPQVLSSAGRWRDPADFLACRVDVTSVVTGNGVLTATSAHSGAVVFALDEQADGWRLLVVHGEYPYSALELCADGDFLRLRATLAGAVDPMIPGTRARLAFDLRSDLVTLG